MSTRPLLTVILGTVALHYLLQSGFLVMNFVHGHMDERATFDFQLGSSGDLDTWLTGNALSWARFAAAVLPFGAALVLFANRSVLAERFAGPADSDQPFITRRALQSAGLAVLGVVLVLRSLTIIGFAFTTRSAWALSDWNSLFRLIEPSLSMMIGATLVFLHPVLAMWGASSRDQ